MTSAILKPAFSTNNITIVFNSNNRFVKYLAVAIGSIIHHSSKANNYDLIVLTQDISDENKDILRKWIGGFSNFSIRFYNMDEYVNKYAVADWHVINHLNISAYYRVFLCDLLKNFDRAVYLDADLVVQSDIAQLYKSDLGGRAVGAVKDCFLSRLRPGYEPKFPTFCEYAKSVLNMDDLSCYFNSGVMVFDIAAINKQYALSDFIEIGKKNNRFFHDQNILNSVFFNNTQILDDCWNVQMHSDKNYSLDEIKIIHFSSKAKPWDRFDIKFAHMWWLYARQTPFYEEVLKNIISNNISVPTTSKYDEYAKKLYRRHIKYRYRRYKLLSRITFGHTHKYYKKKRKEMKALLQNIKG